MGSVVAILVGLAPMSADGATRHGHRLAPESFRLVLDMEAGAPAGKTENNCGDSQLDSAQEPRQPVVGSPPRIHGELLKLGIEVAQSTVAKYLRRHRKP